MLKPIIKFFIDIANRIIGFFLGIHLLVASVLVKLLIIGVAYMLGLLLVFPVAGYIYGFAVLIRIVDGFVYVFSFPGLTDFITGIDSQTSQFFKILSYALFASLGITFFMLSIKWTIYGFKNVRHELATTYVKLILQSIGRMLVFVGSTLLFVLFFKYVLPVIYVGFVSITQTITKLTKSTASGITNVGFWNLFIAEFQASMIGAYVGSPIKTGYMLMALLQLLDVGGDTPIIDNIQPYYDFLNISQDGSVPSTLPDIWGAFELSLNTLNSQLPITRMFENIGTGVINIMTNIFSGTMAVLGVFGGGFLDLIILIITGLFKFYVFFLFIKSLIKWLFNWGVKLIVSLAVMLIGLLIYTPILSLYVHNDEQYQSTKNQWIQHIKTTAFNLFTGTLIFIIPVMVALFSLLILTIDSNILSNSAMTSIIGLFVFIFAGDLYNWIVNKIANVLDVEVWAEMEVGSRLINKSISQIKKTVSQSRAIASGAATGGAALISSVAKSAAGLKSGIKSAKQAGIHKKLTGKGNTGFQAYRKHVGRQFASSGLKDNFKHYSKTQWSNVKKGSEHWTTQTKQNLTKGIKENINPYANREVKQMSNIRNITSNRMGQNVNNGVNNLDALIKKLTNQQELQVAGVPQPMNKNVEKLLTQIAQNSEVNRNQTLAKIDGLQPQQTIINNVQLKDGGSVGKIKMNNDIKEVKKLTNKIEHLTNKIDKN